MIQTYNEIVVIVGFSASGKDTQMNKLVKLFDYNPIISLTTRPMRPGEEQGNPYYFVSKEEILKLEKEDKLVEMRTYHTTVKGVKDTWYYAVRKRDVVDYLPYTTVLDLQGLKDFKKYYGDRVISIFLNVTEEERRKRCIERGDYDETEWNRRYIDDMEKFPNDEVRSTVDKVCNVTNLTEHEVLQVVKTSIIDILADKEQKKKQNKPVLMVDLDDTLNQLVPKWLEVYKSMTQEEIDKEDITTWNIDSYASFPEVFMKILEIPYFFYGLKPQDNAIKVLTKLKSKFDIVIVSSANGDPHIIKSKIDWIKNYLPFIPIKSNVIFTSDKHRVKADYMIDDGIFILDKRINAKKLVLDQPWNRNFKGIQRFNNWLEIEEYLNDQSEIWEGMNK